MGTGKTILNLVAKAAEYTKIKGPGSIKITAGIFQNASGISSKKMRKLQEIQEKMTMKALTNIGRYIESPIKSLEIDFVSRKAQILKEMKGICTPEQFQRLEKADTPEKMTKFLFSEEFKPYHKIFAIEKELPKGKMLLEYEQMAQAAAKKRQCFIVAREMGMHIPSTKPEVIKIENILKEKYGVEFVSLKDDEKMANAVLKAFEIADKRKVPLPKKVFISDFMAAYGENLYCEDAIILASNAAEDNLMGITLKAMAEMPKNEIEILQNNARFLPNLNQFSTDEFAHIPLHEIFHNLQLKLGAYGLKKIPSSMRKTKEKLSLYSALAPTNETFVELKTKEALVGLNEEEQILERFLNFWG